MSTRPNRRGGGAQRRYDSRRIISSYVGGTHGNPFCSSRARHGHPMTNILRHVGLPYQKPCLVQTLASVLPHALQGLANLGLQSLKNVAHAAAPVHGDELVLLGQLPKLVNQR